MERRSTREVRPSAEGVVPRPAEEIAGLVGAGLWEGRTLAGRLRDVAARTPSSTALVDREVRLTYRELDDRVDGAAGRLAELGLRSDDRIVFALPNRWEFVVLTFACFRLGVIPVMALPAHRRRELVELADQSDARAVVVESVVDDVDHRALAHAVAEDTGIEFVIVAGDTSDDEIDLRALCAPAATTLAASQDVDATAPDPRSVALFLLSGGTTGSPKLIPRTHDDLGYAAVCSAEVCEFGPDTVYLAVLALAHNYTLAGPGLLGTLFHGGRVVIAPSPAPRTALPLIESEAVTVTSVVPAVLQRWLEARAADPDSDLGSLRLVQVGGSRLPDHVAGQVRPLLGGVLQQGYGMGEGLICFTRPGDPDSVVCHTQGRPISAYDEIRVVDADDRPVPPGTSGALLTRGPYTVRSYYRAPEHDARSFTSDGWYRTGDVVRVDPSGNLVVEGRDKDMINRAGEKISAEEVEDLALRMATVSRAAAVAAPDPSLGERVCLYVVPQGREVPTLTDVRASMTRAGAARLVHPEHLVVVDELPLTAVGKTDKKALRADIAARLAGDAPAA